MTTSPMPTSPLRPSLKKLDAVQLDDLASKKLNRGISRATDNVNLVSKARNEFALDFRDFGVDEHVQYFVETPIYTFTLPDLTVYSDEFRAFLERDLIEMSTLISLEQAGRLNWWSKDGVCQRLWPLATTGDGNCLLHAASLGMWGFHDRLLTLRKALHATLTYGSYRGALWRRWRWQQALTNREAGLVYSEEEWQREWENLLRLSSTEPRAQLGRRSSCSDVCNKGPNHDIYESLEEIHVLALAHVLRRPIVVIADTILKDVTGEPFAPIPFGGVYLPLECPPNECHRSPLVLTYDAAHFSALVAMEKEKSIDEGDGPMLPTALIPLTGPDHQLLPVQFSLDPGVDFNWQIDDEAIENKKLNTHRTIALLHEYLDMIQVRLDSPCNGHSGDESKLNCVSSNDSLTLARSKAAKQLQSVAKQFGSVGRTMSKKLKKNLGTLSRLGRSNSLKETGSNFKCKDVKEKSASQCSTPRNQRHAIGKDLVLAAVLHTEKRHEYQEEMIRNYLHAAHERFERELREKPNLSLSENSNETNRQPVENLCSLFSTMDSYGRDKGKGLKNNDFKKFNTMSLYGAGKSHFYAESDLEMFSNVSKMPLTCRPSPNQDQTLYLSKSTFYNDVKRNVEIPAMKCVNKPNIDASKLCQTPDCQYFGSEGLDYFCSQCYKKQKPTNNCILQLRTTHI